MAGAGGDFRPTRLLSRLAGAGVDFVVIGGVAVTIQASPRFTDDLDVCYSTAPENLEALGGVLTKLKGRLRGVAEDVPFVPDAATLRRTQMLCLDTRDGPIDLLVDPPGAPPYPRLRRRADVIDLDGAAVPVASIQDLIAMKQAAARPIDQADLEALRIARRLAGRRRRSTG